MATAGRARRGAKSVLSEVLQGLSSADTEASDDDEPQYSMEEVKRHSDEKSCWIVIDDAVYDVTDFLDEHPGGGKMLLGVAGTDATGKFKALHKDYVLKLFGKDYRIGKLVLTAADLAAQAASEEVDLPDAAFVADTADLQPSEHPSWNSGGTAGILPAERAKATFDVEIMTNLLDGGVEETERRRFIVGAGADATKTLLSPEKYDMQRGGADGAIASAFKHFMRVHGPWLQDMYVPAGNEMLYMNMGAMAGGYPGFGLFILTLMGQCSDEQKSWWFERCYLMKITGAYAQTELGHGSNVRGLQTTATYDSNSEEWILDTPTLDSMKWWPSNMVMATHCVVYAQMIIDGKERGVHVFFVQLRDEDLMPLPGIEIGDIVGDNFVDIGYLRMKGVRVPRRHLMEKRQHVEPDGTYVKHGGPTPSAAASKGHYLTMMGARVNLASGAAGSLAKAAVIATRYNLVRRQGFKDTAAGQSFKAPEHQIIDYGMNRYRIFTQLAAAYAIRFVTQALNDKMMEIQFGGDISDSELQGLHAASAGLKGYCCNAAAVGIEELRKCCGGAGYLLASGIAPLEADFKWRATAEGDTVVMLLQTARHLVKERAEAGESKKDGNSLLTKRKPVAVADTSGFLDLDYLKSLFEYRTTVHVDLLAKQLQEDMASGLSFDESWSALTLKACKTGQSHVMSLMLSAFVDAVKKAASAPETAAAATALSRLAALFGLAELQDGQQWSGLLDLEQMQLAEQACDQICEAIRPDACALADAWDFPDRVLNSTIGLYDGNIYEAQYSAAASSPLNTHKVPDFLAAVKPHLELEFLALRNKLPPEADEAWEDMDDDDYADDDDDYDDDYEDDEDWTDDGNEDDEPGEINKRRGRL